MKKPSSKKGFSLIELIVVIAVIAAIAAVIVPSITNMSAAAKNAADQRNVQLWNEMYSNAYALIGTAAVNAKVGDMTVTKALPTVAASYTTAGVVPEIDVSVTMSDGTALSFVAPSFTVAGGGTYTFTAGRGLSD